VSTLYTMIFNRYLFRLDII